MDDERPVSLPLALRDANALPAWIVYLWTRRQTWE
jgi:hypothetical protein